jgi:predicted transcriptional regulator
MSQNVQVCHTNMNIHEAAQIMGQSQIRRLPVVENNQLVGMLALGDLAQVDMYNDEAEEALSDISLPNQDPRNLN